ncbi:type-F conjugative transfer system pilin acetylase TraX [Entomohabitans teleogrylli]|uniref:type-F conjugative transfer system pilin acetylase TraX n=1 Tax=Entomohabitans teleogrylli TaxID=1384589 RepID=UPI00073D58FA|nr:type-F conjugative transfer system pilin acetylase TraX [Entomohabitans teleogrylli]
MNNRKQDMMAFVPVSPAGLDWLKIIALLAMVADHVSKVFGPGIPELQLAGRMAFPLFAFVWGCNINRHPVRQSALNRMWFYAVLCQPPYWFAFESVGYPWFNLNILFAFGVAGQVLKAADDTSRQNLLSALLALSLLPFLSTSYEVRGLLLLLASAALFRVAASENARLFIVLWCCVAYVLNHSAGAIYALSGSILSVVTVAAVQKLTCAGNKRLLSGWFFVTGYSAHLFIIGLFATGL